jgi:HEAT repeat protein
MATAASDESDLAQAGADLLSPQRPVRERAERTLLAAKERCAPHLASALEQAVRQPTDPGIAGRIALLLGALRARSALPSLLLAARSELAPDDRALVARALAEIFDGRDAFDDEARAALERFAADNDRFVRAFAARGLGALGDVRSRARVEALATDPDAFVRETADGVLAKLRREDAEQAAAGTDLSDFAALLADAQGQGGQLKPFLDDLGDERRPVREAAVAQLVRAGAEAVPFLLDRLNQPNPLPRISAAQALGRIQSPEAAGPLLIAATAPTRSEREQELVPVALRALANCLTGTEEGLAPALLPLARDPDRFVRAGALLCLGRIADRAGIEAVVRALTDKDPFVIESASIALSEGVREEDIALVLPLLEAYDAGGARGSPALREAILIALSRIEIEAPPVRVRVRHRVRREIGGATAALRKASLALLERLFDDDDPPPLPVLDEAMARLRDAHPEVRVVAASFLSQHLKPGFTGAVPRLIDAALKKERTLSLLCCEALRRHDTPEAREALEVLTRSDDGPVAMRAAELVDGFEPQRAEWRFEKKGRAEPPSPARAESQRPKPEAPRRVRPASSEPRTPGESAAGRAEVVEARFEPDDDKAKESGEGQARTEGA